MATGDTVVDIQLFRSTAETMNPIINSLNSLFDEWQTTVKSMRGEWQGDTSDDIRNTAAQIAKSSADLMKSIGSWQSTLNELAGIYQAGESKAEEQSMSLNFDSGSMR